MRSARASANATLAIACLSLLGLAACATVPKTELDPSAVAGIRSIVLLKVPEPPGITVPDLDGASSAAELSGGFAQADIDGRHAGVYAQRLAERQFSFAQAMSDSITRALRGDGYRISYLADQVPQLASNGESYDFSGLSADTDAVMLIWYTVAGYVSPPGTADYMPWIGARARVFDARTGRELYFKTFNVGYDNSAKNVVNLPADARYRYPGFDALTRNTDASIGGITAAIDAIAARIGSDFAQASTGAIPAAASIGEPQPARAAVPRAAPVPLQSAPDDGLVPLRQAVTLRTQPRTQAAIVAVLPAGQRIKVDPRARSNADGNWHYIEAGPNSGWALGVQVAP